MTDPPGLVVEHIGGMCPVQGYGTLNGERFYFRFRSDRARLDVGPADPDEPDMPADPPRLYAEIHAVFGDPYAGYLTDHEARRLLQRLVAELKPMRDWPHGTRRGQLATLLAALVGRRRPG